MPAVPLSFPEKRLFVVNCGSGACVASGVYRNVPWKTYSDTTSTDVICTDCSSPTDSDLRVPSNTDSIKTEEINENRVYKGIRLHVTAQLDTVRQKIAMDIGFGDVITPEPQELEYPLLLDGLPAVSIMAYSLETVVAEKFQAMIELSENNSRMKDFYDLYTLLYNNTLENYMLEKAIHATLKNRGTVYEENHPLFSDDFPKNLRFQMLWKGFIRKIGKTEPNFETAVSLIKERLFPYWKKYKEQ